MPKMVGAKSKRSYLSLAVDWLTIFYADPLHAIFEKRTATD